MEGLGLPTTCQRLGVNFMGCFGALSGIKTARAFAAERYTSTALSHHHSQLSPPTATQLSRTFLSALSSVSPRHVVVLVCCELCSLHMQLDARIDNMVGSALFSDGASAVVICQPSPSSPHPPLFELHHSHSLIIPNTQVSTSNSPSNTAPSPNAGQSLTCSTPLLSSQSMMAWELTNSGMSIGLGREIPQQIYSAIDDFTVGLMRQTEAWGVEYAAMKWCLHPGGPMIIQAIVDRLGLKGDEGGVKEVWDVLRSYGNMSSATLIFVLDAMRKQVSPVIHTSPQQLEVVKALRSSLSCDVSVWLSATGAVMCRVCVGRGCPRWPSVLA